MPEVVDGPAGGGGGGGGGGGNAEDSPAEEKEGQCSTFPPALHAAATWARAEWNLGRLNILRGAKNPVFSVFSNTKKVKNSKQQSGDKGYFFQM